jgi:LCP family protein required for cell wall assembly
MYSPMHEFRKQTGRAPRQALDGFLNRGAGGRAPSGGHSQPALRRPRLDGLRTPNRTVSDFRRPEGLHASQSTHVKRVGTTIERPARPQQPHTQAAKDASLLHMTLPAGGFGSRKERRKAKKDARKERAKKGGKLYQFRKWGLRGALVALALLIGVGGFLGIKGALQINKVLKGGGKAAALQQNVKPQLLKGEGDGRINFMLLGRGGDGHDGPDLTDTILIASIDPVNKSAALVSIPRDLWVSVSGYGSMKINSVFANAKYDAQNTVRDEAKAEEAGMKVIQQEITDILGIPIHYHVMMDFKAFEEAVNAVGGVDINAPEALVDYTMAWQNGGKATLAQKGHNHLDGRQALMYVRSRHGSARGDFDRTERQRVLITALSQKVTSAGTYTNPVKISQLLSAFGDHVSTDLSVNDSIRLLTLLKGVGGSKITSVGLADPPNSFVRTDNVSGASVVRPTAGFDAYTEIQNYIRNTLKDPYLAKENAAVQVFNGTVTPGLASSTGDKLKSYGYNVIKVDSAPTSDYAKTVIVDLTKGKKPYTKNYLLKRFGVKNTVSKLPDTTMQATGADFVIILGQDASANSQN